MTPNPVSQLQDLNQVKPARHEMQAGQSVLGYSQTPQSLQLCLQEAAQSALDNLNVALASLGFIQGDEVHWQSMVSQVDRIHPHPFMPLHCLPIADTLSTQVWQTRKTYVIKNTEKHFESSSHWLVQRYGIRSYLGVPILTANRSCVGILEVMDLEPREFSRVEIVLLETIARWCASELDRYAQCSDDLTTMVEQEMYRESGDAFENRSLRTSKPLTKTPQINPAKFELLTQLMQTLRTPLTPVVGMTSVLRQQIHGNLTLKQREYLDIVYQSSQDLLTLINEIVEISLIDPIHPASHPVPTDVEMLCQQAIATLEVSAARREQRIRLTSEEGARIWLLDRDHVRQCLYHLIVGITEGASPGSTISIHLSRRNTLLRLVIWVSHPWLGDGLRQTELVSYQSLLFSNSSSVASRCASDLVPIPVTNQGANGFMANAALPEKTLPPELLRILLSRGLAEVLGGQLTLQGSAETGYRLILNLPPANSEASPLLDLLDQEVEVPLSTSLEHR